MFRNFSSSSTCIRSFVFSFALATVLQTTDLHAASPELYDLYAESYGGFVVVTGYVYDADEDPEGWTVTLWGDISGTATVDGDGDFETSIPYGLPYGDVYAQTSDSEGNLSDVEEAEITE